MAKILVIDDEPGIRGVIRDVLEDAGHEVTALENGRNAVNQIKRAPIDLVITDIFMPEVEGLETIRFIHRLYPDMPIIAISGIDFQGRDYLGMSQKFGATATLKKPFWPEELLDLVVRVLVLN